MLFFLCCSWVFSLLCEIDVPNFVAVFFATTLFHSFSFFVVLAFFSCAKYTNIDTNMFNDFSVTSNDVPNFVAVLFAATLFPLFFRAGVLFSFLFFFVLRVVHSCTLAVVVKVHGGG